MQDLVAKERRSESRSWGGFHGNELNILGLEYRLLIILDACTEIVLTFDLVVLD